MVRGRSPRASSSSGPALSGSTVATAYARFRTTSSPAFRVGRSAEERIDGRPSVVVERRGGGRLTISTIAEAALLSEIVERLTELQLGAQRARRIADDVDSWARPSENGYASYLATPGPG
jgi:hypothetical protein